MITVDVQHRGGTVLLGATGELGEYAGESLRAAVDGVPVGVRDLLVDLHGVPVMDRDGLLNHLDAHRRAERRGLRVLVTGWQPQPQQCMADIAGVPGARNATGEWYAVAGFRKLIEQRANHARHSADFTAGWLPST
ncbi:STAS domain-containing protein [Streptomyces sp. A0592]|uniref:STAS domain-containing protein n=1 Tax=Streptomyces sp. A0592 TaxID=2563099 RepID=UPI00109E38B5|nr:STAS domain-containing protein [Streptomyces sp. A0592]THA77824.1 anti-sigma factor antagonist [Streptomyces sp. A0592]